MCDLFWESHLNKLTENINSSKQGLLVWANQLRCAVDSHREWLRNRSVLVGDKCVFDETLYEQDLEIVNMITNYVLNHKAPRMEKVDARNYNGVETRNPGVETQTSHNKNVEQELQEEIRKLENLTRREQNIIPEEEDMRILARRKFLEEQELFNDPNNIADITIDLSERKKPTIVKSCEEMLRDAPTITPLLKLNRTDRERLMYDLFKKSKEQVFNMLMSTRNLTRDEVNSVYEKKTVDERVTHDEIYSLIKRETDKAVDVWKKNNEPRR